MRTKLVLSGLALLSLSGAAMGAGTIRDLGVGVAGHSAFSIGHNPSSGVGFSSTTTAANYFGAANPVSLGNTVPNALAPTSSSGSSFYNPDVAANPTNSAGYGSNYLSAFHYFISSGTNARGAVYSSTGTGFGTATEGSSSFPVSYSGNTAIIQYLGAGTGAVGNAGAWRANFTQTTIVTDGASAGAGGIFSSFTIQRLVTGGIDDNTPVNFSLGLIADIEPGGNAGTGTTLDLTAAGQRGTRLTIGSNFAEVIGYGATSQQVGNRSTAAGGLNTSSALGGTGELSNSTTATTAPAVGLVWRNVSIAAGESVTFYTGVGFNQAAVPAPASVALLGLGGLVAARRRRN